MREHSWQCGSIRAPPRAIGASAVSAARVAPSQVVGARYQECPAPGAQFRAGSGARVAGDGPPSRLGRAILAEKAGQLTRCR